MKKSNDYYMGLAIDQAYLAEEKGEVPVGAIFIENDKIIASAGNSSIELNDPTAHAEIMVLRLAAKKKKNYRVGGTLIVTLEPCIMCMGALIHSRVNHLIFGAYDQKSGGISSIYDLANSPNQNHHIDYIGGVMEQECIGLLKNFFKAKRQ